MKIYLCFLALFAMISCQKTPSSNSRTIVPKQIKNIILLIGDGMGLQQLNLGNLYLKAQIDSRYPKKQLTLFKKTKHSSLSLVKPHNALVVDSACSATQLSIGEPALSESIGVSATGRKAQTILELAKSMGKSTALISNTRLTHATPASFAAHITSRKQENEIAKMMIDTGVDYMISGGLRHFIPKDHKSNQDFQKKWRSKIEPHIYYSSKRKDNKNLLQYAKDKGYQVSFTYQDYLKSPAKKHLALLENSRLPYSIDLKNLKEAKPSIPEITAATLDKLAKNPKGFFLMAEEGLIDWAGHANDAATMLHEVLQMDKTYEAILNWAKDRDDTLVIVTADHETGGFGFSYRTRDIDEPSPFPGQEFPDVNFKPGKNYGSKQSLKRLMGQKSSFAAFITRSMRESYTPENLCQLVKEHVGIAITKKNCQDIIAQAVMLKRASKKYTLENLHHEYFHNYTNTPLQVHNLLGRTLAPYFNTVWATGSHTSTPVGVFVTGPENMNYKDFTPVMSHPQLGKVMKKWLRDTAK